MDDAVQRPVADLDLAAARRLALAAQGFASRRHAGVSRWPAVAAVIDRLGLFQLDSVNVLVRAHYLPAFSRIGAYDLRAFERRAFGPKRTLFEYWAHEASLLPLAVHPLLRWRMTRAAAGEGIYAGLARFARDNRDYVATVLRQVRERGPLAAADLGETRSRSSSWWGWDRGKAALEFLFWAGEITTAERRGAFERVYDLTERVIPPDILAGTTPAEPDAMRRLVTIAARSLGIATEADLRDYFRLPLAPARRAIAELAEAGQLVPARVEGWRHAAFLPADPLPPGAARPTALLSPFDPLVWHRDRAERLFGLRYRIEIYTPAHKREFGYYVLPFLLRGAFAARVDLKADRSAGVLRVQAAHPEPGSRGIAVAEALAAELRRLAAWLGLGSVEVGPAGGLAGPLRAAIW